MRLRSKSSQDFLYLKTWYFQAGHIKAISKAILYLGVIYLAHILNQKDATIGKSIKRAKVVAAAIDRA